MVVLVDIDNVLNNFVEVCVQMYNENYNTHYDFHNVTTYDIASSLGITDWKDFLNNYILSSKVSDRCLPITDGPYYLEKINKLCELYVVTARDWHQLDNIREWFQSHYSFINDSQIIRCSNKNLIMGDILIDDCLDNLLNFSRGRICFDYPYNRDINDLTNFITRVHNWHECYNVLKLKLL